MNIKRVSLWTIIATIMIFSLLAACSQKSDSQSTGGTLAMVDTVTVQQKDNHDYAVINGFYPDTCTRVSYVEQSVDGTTIKLTIKTDRPADMMCAQMLTPYTIDILLTTGSLEPQEYTVVVNDGPTTSFILE